MSGLGPLSRISVSVSLFFDSERDSIPVSVELIESAVCFGVKEARIGLIDLSWRMENLPYPVRKQDPGELHWHSKDQYPYLLSQEPQVKSILKVTSKRMQSNPLDQDQLK